MNSTSPFAFTMASRPATLSSLSQTTYIRGALCLSVIGNTFVRGGSAGEGLFLCNVGYSAVERAAIRSGPSQRRAGVQSLGELVRQSTLDMFGFGAMCLQLGDLLLCDFGFQLPN